MNQKPTNYTEIKNLLIVLSFNQPIQVEVEVPENSINTHQSVTKYQPIVINTRADVLTVEGAQMGLSENQNVGEPSDVQLTHEQLYAQLYALSPVLAAGKAAILLEGIDQDVSGVDTSQIAVLTMADIAKPEVAQPAQEAEVRV